MIKAGFGESSQSVQGDADCRGDEVGVKAGGMRPCHDRDEIAPRTRLAAGEMHLQNAEYRGLGKHTRPGLRVKLASSAG